MELKKAIDKADKFQKLIAPYCDHVQVAGSIRRLKPEVNDIEIVAVPKIYIEMAYDMFLNRCPPDDIVENYLLGFLSKALSDGTLTLDPALKRNGDKYKRFLFDGMPLDLFIADEDNLGNILAIRTGNAEFSHQLVTPRNQGGLMPSYLKQKDGYLWNGNSRIVCQTEQDFFDAIGIPFVEPRERNEQATSEIKRGLKP